jgi:ABC-type antimicrobial peptide transport system permease subunit
VVTRTIVVQGLFLALFIGMVAGVVPSFGAARRSVAETLREVF